MTNFQRAVSVILSLCFFAVLAVSPGRDFLWKNVYRQLPLYCFVEKEAGGALENEDPAVSEMLIRKNAQYLAEAGLRGDEGESDTERMEEDNEENQVGRETCEERGKESVPPDQNAALREGSEGAGQEEKLSAGEEPESGEENSVTGESSGESAEAREETEEESSEAERKTEEENSGEENKAEEENSGRQEAGNSEAEEAEESKSEAEKRMEEESSEAEEKTEEENSREENEAEEGNSGRQEAGTEAGNSGAEEAEEAKSEAEKRMEEESSKAEKKTEEENSGEENEAEEENSGRQEAGTEAGNSEEEEEEAGNSEEEERTEEENSEMEGAEEETDPGLEDSAADGADPEGLSDYDELLNRFYIVDPATSADPALFDGEKFLAADMSLKQDSSAPQILIYHSHSQEAFADSREGEPEDTIVGVGNYLTELLTENYGYQVIHVTEAFDVIDGEIDRSRAYDYAREYVEQLLEENPSVEVIIDLHRDGVPEDRRLVTEINGKSTAQIMLFNGLSYTNNNGPVEYLPNPYIQDNLAFSFQLEYEGAARYPGFYRGIYLAGLRYNLHLRPKALLLEAGAQTNTLQEVKNAMEPFAENLDRVLSP